MGTLHGKDRTPKFLDIHNSSFKTGQYEAISDEETERSFVVVWCDSTIGSSSNSDDDINTLMQLASVVNRKRQLIHTFSELDACKDFISSVYNICLIVSGAMGTQLVPLVHNLVQVHSIYIFCYNKPKYELWAKQYEKIRGVYTNIKEICDYLKKCFLFQSSVSEYDQLQMDILKKDLTLPTTDKQELAFIYPILSKIILLTMNSIKQQDMINYCQIEYTNEYQKQLINDFEKNYSHRDPIWWFTRDNFFQKIINRALQIHDFYTLCMMSPFIKDMVNQLTQLHGQQMSSSPKTLDLYTCQSISTDDFDKIKSNQGGLMCINQFLLANTEQAISMMFIKHQISTSINANNVNIVLKISTSQSVESNVSYANIGVKSQFVHEKEYLFSMSSIFRIEIVEQSIEIPSAWYVHVTLIDKNDKQLTNLTQSINHDQLVPEFGSTITNKLCQFKPTRKLFEQALYSRTKHIRSILLHYNMGIIYDCLKEYDKAIDEYKDAIKLTRQSIPDGYQKDCLCLIPLYSNMGLCYQRKNTFPHAFDHAFRALSILSNDQENSIFKKEISASTHFNLGLIHELEGKTSEAKIYYEHALKNRRECLPNNHPDVMSLQSTISSLTSQ